MVEEQKMYRRLDFEKLRRMGVEVKEREDGIEFWIPSKPLRSLELMAEEAELDDFEMERVAGFVFDMQFAKIITKASR